MSMSFAAPAWGDAHAPLASAVAHVEPRVEELPADASGVRTVIEYRINPQTNRREKVTRRIRREVRTYAIPEGVLERQKWLPFGEAIGGNEGCTTLSYENLHIEKPSSAAATEASDLDKLSEIKSSIVRCRKCGATTHYTLKCPLRDAYAGLEGMAGGEGDGMGASGGMPGGPGDKDGVSAGGRYVPPGARRDTAAEGSGPTEMPPEEMRRLRIGNLSEDVDEDELRGLLVRFGKVEGRINIKQPLGKGGNAYAHVTYSSHSEAAKAKEALDGFGFHYLILKVEFAKSAPQGFSGSGGLATSGFVSGYGKALPQNRG